MKKLLITALLVLTPVVVFAKDDKAKNKWNGEAELGFLKTTGNTDTTSFHTRGKIVNERDKWKHLATIEIIDKEESGTTTAKRTYLVGKSDYKIDDLSYLFFSLSYEDDQFSGYDYQYTEAFGYGYHVIKEDDLKLYLEAGAGARQSKLTTGQTTSEGIVKGSANLEWNFSKTSMLTQFIGIESGSDNTITRSVTAVKVLVVGNLSAKLSYSVKHNSDVPAGKEKTDTETVITLVYNF